MLFRFAAGIAFLSGAQASVEDTWNRADETISEARKKFAEVRKHADEAAVQEERILEQSKKDLAMSQVVADEAAAKLREGIASLKAPVAPAPISTDSSFLELPDSLASIPGMAEDMAKVHEAERVYQDKMQNLKQRDNELMDMARGNFEDSKRAIEMVNTLRSESNSFRQPSFLQKGSSNMEPYFQKIRQAEDELQKITDKTIKDFNLV